MEEHSAPDKPVAQAHADQFELFQNMPNPFSIQTVIAFTVHHGSNWTVRVEDRQGRAVRTFAGNEGGTMTLAWDGTDDNGAVVQNGTYFCLLASDGHTDLRRMTLIR